MAETSFLDKSVTLGDQGKVENGVINLMIPYTYTMSGSNLLLPPQPPPYWSRSRDEILRASVLNEAMWAAAVYVATTKCASRSWRIDSTSDRRAKLYQELYLQADGPQIGWVQFLSKQVLDFLCLDNGSFVEIVREKKGGFASRVVGLRHLDGLRITRSGDPKIPAIYRDRRNKVHEMMNYQIMMFSDMPDSGEMYYGVGHCAAERAYNAIYKLAAIEWYLREKVAGLRPLAIYVVNGLVQAQIEGAVNAAKEQAIARGLAAYMGAVLVGVPSDKPPTVATIPLAELPDRFNRKEEFDISILTYADAIGIDVQDLQPLSGQGLSTGTQSLVLAEKANGKGLASWQQQWTHQNNELVLPDATTWTWFEKDYRDMSAQADYESKRIKNQKDAIEAGIIMPDQALQILVDQEVYPKEFLPEDKTPGGSMADDEKLTPDVKPAEEQPVEGSVPQPGEQPGNETAPVSDAADIPDVSGAKEFDLPIKAAQELLAGLRRKETTGLAFDRKARVMKLRKVTNGQPNK